VAKWNGKEMVATEIFFDRARVPKPLYQSELCRNSETLIESEFFGHERGAFTERRKNVRDGLNCDTGQFVGRDQRNFAEIYSKLSPVLQNASLSAWVESNDQSQCAVLATTNPGSQKSVENQEFRQDLYYRLKCFPDRCAAAQERKDDLHGAGQGFPLSNRQAKWIQRGAHPRFVEFFGV